MQALYLLLTYYIIILSFFFYYVNQSYNDLHMNNPKWSLYEDEILIDDFFQFLQLKQDEHIRSKYDIYMRLQILQSNITKNILWNYPNPRRVIDPGNLVFYKNGPYQRKWNLGIINKVRNPNGPTNYYYNEPILNSLSAIGRQFGSKLIPKREGIRNSTTRQTVQSYQSRITPSVRRTIKKLKPGETYKTRLPGNSRKAP